MSDLDKNIQENVLDISYFQTNTVDFEQLKKDGFWGVVIRVNDASTSMAKDAFFEHNYAGAKAAGLHVGAYWFTRATSVDFALRESEKCFEYCKGKQFDLPIYLDIEGNEQFSLGKSICTQIVRTFCENLQKKHQMFVGCYCSTFYTENYIGKEVTDYYAMWIADWGAQCRYKGQYGMWQVGTIKTRGVDNGNSPVDYDICYVDYPSAIKSRGMNGYTKPKSLKYTVVKDTPKVVLGDVVKSGTNIDVYGRKTVCGVQYGRVNDSEWISLKDCKERG